MSNEELCVLIGTPLIDLLDEEDKFSVKPKRPEEQTVRDEKGRRRFHGAFTGGFSAGYFNTVGSEEGWAPNAFKSSRGEQIANSKFAQRPEDFMDEEDFAEHGIAPKLLSVKSDYTSEQKKKPAAVTVSQYLEDLVAPVRSTLGVRMLKKMGWREGQGIGPKIKRRLRDLKEKHAKHEPGRKMYGVTLPNESDISDYDEEQQDEYLVSEFDVNAFQFEVKEDMFGLGYKRLDVNRLFGGDGAVSTTGGGGVTNEASPAASLLFPMLASKSASSKSAGQKKPKSRGGDPNGIRGEAFGGAFGGAAFDDEEEVEVYKQDNLESYDFALNDNKQLRKQLNTTYGFGAYDQDMEIMSKFATSKNKQQPWKVHVTQLEIPSNFNFLHKFADATAENTEERLVPAGSDSMHAYLKTATERAQLLGETPIQPESVFDLLKQTDRDFLVAKQHQFAPPPLSAPKKQQQEAANEALSKEAKAKRYEAYISFVKRNFNDPYSFVDHSELTEWEAEKEKEEFLRNYSKQNKLVDEARTEHMKRFESVSTLTERNEEVMNRKPAAVGTGVVALDLETNLEETSEMHKAALEKKYGKSTRVQYEWRPHATLCKRFNIPNPFPNTKEIGTVKSDDQKQHRTEKFSAFNFLTYSAINFDSGKSKTLFDEINAQSDNQPQKEQQQTLSKPQEEAASNQLEFDTKVSKEVDKKNSLFNQETASKQETVATTSTAADEQAAEDAKNVYLQERPAFDIFKAIFEDDEDEITEETSQEEPNQNEGEKLEEPEITTVTLDMNQNGNQAQASTTVIPSSIGSVDMKYLSKYLAKSNNDYEEEEKIPVQSTITTNVQVPGSKFDANTERIVIFSKKKPPADKPSEPKVEPIEPKINEAEKLSTLLKSLAAKKKPHDDDESSDSSSSSNESESEDIEIVYEELPADGSKKKHKHKKKSKKKKKHSHKKKKLKKSKDD